MLRFFRRAKKIEEVSAGRQFCHSERILDRKDRFLNRSILELEIKKCFGNCTWTFRSYFAGDYIKKPEDAGVEITLGWLDELDEMGDKESWQTGLNWRPEGEDPDLENLVPWQDGDAEGWYHVGIIEDPMVILDGVRKSLLGKEWTMPMYHHSYRVTNALEIMEWAKAKEVEVIWGGRHVLDESQMEAIRDFVSRLHSPNKRAIGPYCDEEGRWGIWKNRDGTNEKMDEMIEEYE